MSEHEVRAHGDRTTAREPGADGVRGRSPRAAPTIAHVATRLLTIPLHRPWAPDVTTLSVVAVDVTDRDGGVGHGFSWTPTIGGAAARAMLDDHVAPWAVGRPSAPTPELWQAAWEHVHEAGGGGITTIALAGLDLALWDLDCRRRGVGLDDALGRRHDSQPAYGSGINRHYSIDELTAQAQRWVAAGFDAVKIKVGLPDLEADIARVAAVRAVIGPQRRLMIDANQLWDVATAARAAEAMAEFDLAWLEEPLRADDTAGYTELRHRTDVPIALGENAHTWYRFRDLIDAGACDVVQPNVVRVGGITPFLRIVALAGERGVAVAPHLLLDLSARLALTMPETTWVEVVEDAAFDDLDVLARPSGVRVDDGRVTADPTVGIGVELRGNH